MIPFCCDDFRPVALVVIFFTTRQTIAYQPKQIKIRIHYSRQFVLPDNIKRFIFSKRDFHRTPCHFFFFAQAYV